MKSPDEDELLFPRLDAESFIEKTSKLMLDHGFDPAHVYAFQKTQRVVTHQNMKFISKADIKEWNDAVREYRRKHKS